MPFNFMTFRNRGNATSKSTRPNTCARTFERLEPRDCPAGFYDLQIIAQTGASGFSSLGDGPSINDNGEIAFVGTSLNDGDGQGQNQQLADNVYAFSPKTDATTALMNRVFMYPKEGSEQSVPGTQNFLSDVQINNSGDVLARRRLNASVQIGFPFGSIQTAPLTYLETWNSRAPNPPGLPSAQIAMGLPAAASAPLWFFLNPVTAGQLPSPLNLASPYDGILLNHAINNNSQVSLSAIVRGAGNNRIATNTNGDLIARGPIGDLVINSMVADNGQTVIATSDGRILTEPWALNGPIGLVAGPANGFSSVGHASVSDDGSVIAFVGASSSTGRTSLYVSTFDQAKASYRTPVQVLGVSDDGILDYGEYFDETGRDTGGIGQLKLDAGVAINRQAAASGSDYRVAFIATNLHGGDDLFSIDIHLAPNNSVSGDAPIRIIGTQDAFPLLQAKIARLNIHDAINSSGELVFFVAMDDGTKAIVRASTCSAGANRTARTPDLSALPACQETDFAISTAFGQSEKEVTIRYSIAANTLDEPLNARVFRSTTSQFDPSTSSPVTGTMTLPLLDNDLAVSFAAGVHEISLQLPTALIHDASAPYLHFVIDPPHNSSDTDGDHVETNEANNAALLPYIRMVTPAPTELPMIISSDLKMPETTFRLEGVPVVAGTRVLWQPDIKFDASTAKNGPKRRVDYVYSRDALTGTPEYSPRFRDSNGAQVLRGGNLTLTVSVAIDGNNLEFSSMPYPVRAKRPDEAIVRAYISLRAAQRGVNLYTADLGRIVRHESSYRQFTDDGLPLFSRDRLGGVGLFQITRPAPSDDEIWNWQKNVDRGIEIFRQKLSMARRYPVSLGLSAGFRGLVRRLNQDRAAQQLAPLTVSIPSFTTEQLRLDAIRGFNGYAGRFLGRELHEFRLVLNADGTLKVNVVPGSLVASVEWERVPASDRPSGIGDPNYVDNVLAEQP